MPSRSSRWIAVLAVTLSCFVNSGCAGVTLGPQVRTEYVIAHAGKPMQVLSQSTVTGRILDGDGAAVQQDVGGWVMMPIDHWDAAKRALEKDQALDKGAAK